MKKIVTNIFYFLVFFGLISLISYLYYDWKIEEGYNVGFPFKFYSEFQLGGNDFKNFGWYLDNFIYNVLISLIVFICGIYLFKKRDRN